MNVWGCMAIVPPECSEPNMLQNIYQNSPKKWNSNPLRTER